MKASLRASVCAVAVSALSVTSLSLSALPASAAPAPGAVQGQVAEQGEAVSAAAKQPTNLALEATATASSIELDEDRFAAAGVNDDDASTRWSSGYDDDNWVQLELAEPSTLAQLEIAWPNACARDFSIQTSTDGESWQTQVERTDQDVCPRTDLIELDLDSPVSFVRMQGEKRWSDYGYSISEFRAFDRKLPDPSDQLALVPEPVQVERGEGQYRLGEDVSIAADADAGDAADLLAGLLRTSTGYDVPVEGAGADADITIAVSDGAAPEGHSAEGYTLDVDDDGIRIGAGTAEGALNAVQTLRQMLPQWIESSTPVTTDWTVPQSSIVDYPRFDQRGLMVDSARSFYTVDEVKRLIDDAAQFKVNRLHLHLTDDQGWRIAMDTPDDDPAGIDYDALTAVSGKTAMTEDHDGEVMGTELGHTGFYTKDDYRTIVDYAGSRGMTVVPEVDLPGHTNAALHAIPQLNSPGSSPQPADGEDTVPPQGTGDVGESSFDADNDATYTFIEEVLRQIAEMTPGDSIHIGGDEAHNTDRADYEKMVDFATQTVADLGKTVVGWNEYSSTDLPDGDAVVQFWNGSGEQVADAVAEHDAKVMHSPAGRTYMPQKQDSRQIDGNPWGCGGPCTLEHAYEWDPASEISGVGTDDVLGVEAAFWGEFIRGVDQAEYYTFPRLLATAETGWSPQESKDTRSFVDRTGRLGGRMALEGINFFPTESVDWTVAATAERGASDAEPDQNAAPEQQAAPEQKAASGLNATTSELLAADAGGTVTTSWRVTAPASPPSPETTASPTDGLSAEVVWDDDETTPVELTAASDTDIEAMELGATLTGTSTRTFDADADEAGDQAGDEAGNEAGNETGDHTGELRVERDGDVVATASVTVTVGDDSDGTDGSGDGDEGGSGDDGSDGDSGNEGDADDSEGSSGSGSSDSGASGSDSSGSNGAASDDRGSGQSDGSADAERTDAAGELPYTGADLLPATLAAAGILLLGAALALIGRRRRS